MAWWLPLGSGVATRLARLDRVGSHGKSLGEHSVITAFYQIDYGWVGWMGYLVILGLGFSLFECLTEAQRVMFQSWAREGRKKQKRQLDGSWWESLSGN